MGLPDPAGAPQAGWDLCSASDTDFLEWSVSYPSLDDYSSESFLPTGDFIPVDSALFPSIGAGTPAHISDESVQNGFQPFEQQSNTLSFMAPAYVPFSFPNPVSPNPEVSCYTWDSPFPEEDKVKQRCPHPDCGKIFKDLKAHMVTHQNERPEKCPIATCDYHIKGFARKYDKNRHTLTHYKGSMVCGFCPEFGTTIEKSFNRADVFKRHLVMIHGAEVAPPNSRRKATAFRGAKPSKTLKASVLDAVAKCSTCSQIFSNAQEFYEHLDDCVLRIIQQEEPTESANARSVAETEANGNVHDVPPGLLLTSSLHRESEGNDMCEESCEDGAGEAIQRSTPNDGKAKRKILVTDIQEDNGSGLGRVRKRARTTRCSEYIGHSAQGIVATKKKAKRVERRRTTYPMDALDEDAKSDEEHSDDQAQIKTEHENIPNLACPFYRHNPQKYQAWACARSAWKTVHRVKEHVYRKHGLPKFKCNRCYEEFQCLDQLNDHQRAETPCVVIKAEPREGVNEEQVLRLKSRKKPNGNISEEGKWSLMYRVIFPKDDIVPSPYYEYYKPQLGAQDELDTTTEVFIKELAGYSHHELPRLLRSRLKHMLDSSACDEVVGIALGTFQQVLASFTMTTGTLTKEEEILMDPIKNEISECSSVWDTPADPQQSSKAGEDTKCGSLMWKGEGYEQDWTTVPTYSSDSQDAFNLFQKAASLLGNTDRIGHGPDQPLEEDYDLFDDGYVSVGSMTISEPGV